MGSGCRLLGREWRYLAVVLPLGVLYLLGCRDGYCIVLWPVIVAVTALVVHCAAVRSQAMRRPYLLIALGLYSIVVGDGIRLVAALVGVSVETVAWHNLPYLAAYPLVAAGLILRVLRHGLERGLVVDTAIVALAVTSGVWTGALSEVTGGGAAPILLIILLISPALATLMLASVVLTTLASGLQDRASRLMVTAAAAMLLGSVLQARTTPPAEGWTTGAMAAYLVGYLAVGLASFSPERSRRATTIDRVHDLAVSRARLVVLGGAAVWGTVALGFATGSERWSALVVAVGMIVLVCARIAEPVWNLSYLTMHDQLTGLPNRTRLVQALSSSTAALTGADAQLAVLFCDLDRFKAVNDTFGHAIGDELLVAVAHRLRAGARQDDVVARLSGDEFVVLANGMAGEAAARDLAARLSEAVSEPLVLSDGTRVIPSISIGYHLTADPAVDPGALLERADSAMYQVKRSSRATTLARPAVAPFGAEAERRRVGTDMAADLGSPLAG